MVVWANFSSLHGSVASFWVSHTTTAYTANSQLMQCNDTFEETGESAVFPYCSYKQLNVKAYFRLWILAPISPLVTSVGLYFVVSLLEFDILDQFPHRYMGLASISP